MSESKKIVRNMAWNVLGLGLPLIVAIIAFPVLIDGMGVERFGVLLLAWLVVGYFSVFDFGIGRAITKLVAEKRGLDARDELPGLIHTSLFLMTILGLVGAFAFAAITPWLVSDVLKIPGNLLSETLSAFRILALSIPIVVISTTLSGVLEAHQRFRLVNSVRLPLGVATFLVPLMLLPISNSLELFVVALVAVRFFAVIAYVFMCFAVVTGLRSTFAIVPAVIPVLLRLGGWMTVSNLVSPLMVYLDRFFVGALISMAAVTYYTTPYELVTRAFLLPRAVMGVLFPEFAATLARDPAETAVLFRRWRNYIFSIMFPFTLVVASLSADLLKVWLGQEFADQSAVVLQLLALGVLINSLAQLAFGLIQGAGQPKVTAGIHIVELPFYLFMLWYLVNQYGINGAALAWLIRVGVDAFVMFYFAYRTLPKQKSHVWQSIALGLLVGFLLIVGPRLPSLSLRLLYVAVVLAAFLPVVWLVLLCPDDRISLKNRFRRASR